MEKWEKMVSDYEEQSGNTLSDDIKAAVLAGKIGDDDLAKHMKLNASRLESYRSVRDEVQSFVQANRNWNATGSQEPSPMELDALQKGRK
eukprot:15443871-Alexandrium_andersonii.AAC.1